MRFVRTETLEFSASMREHALSSTCPNCGMPYSNGLSDEDSWGSCGIEWECGSRYNFGFPNDAYHVTTACERIKSTNP